MTTYESPIEAELRSVEAWPALGSPRASEGVQRGRVASARTGRCSGGTSRELLEEPPLDVAERLPVLVVEIRIGQRHHADPPTRPEETCACSHRSPLRCVLT